jgi:hypothetical protein
MANTLKTIRKYLDVVEHPSGGRYGISSCAAHVRFRG